MKFVQITFRFEYTDRIDKILDDHEVADYVQYPMIQGKGSDGKHYGSKVFPGNFSSIQAMVPDSRINGLLSALDEFRREKEARSHLRAMVMPIEAVVGDVPRKK